MNSDDYKTISPLFYFRVSLAPLTIRRDGPYKSAGEMREGRLSQTADVSLNLAATTVAEWSFEMSVGFMAINAPSKWYQPAISDVIFYVRLSSGFGAFSPGLMF